MTHGEPLPTALPYLEDSENDPIDTTEPEVTPEALPADPEPDAPPAEPAPEAPPAPLPQNDLNTQMGQLLEMQRRQFERQEQEALGRQQQLAAQQQQAHRPLMEREDWRTRYDTALEEAPYSPEARQRLAAMNQELVQEQVQQSMAPMRQQMELEMRGEQVLRGAVTQARTQYGEAISETDFMGVASEVFGNNRAAIVQALDPALNPNAAATQRILAEAAAGRAYLSGRLRTAAPATPPANPRGPARPGNPDRPGRTSTDMWNDENYVNGTINDLYRSNR